MNKPAAPEVSRKATLSGIGLAALSFGIFASHDVLVKILGAEYSIFQIIFFSALFSFAPMTLVMSADRAVDNFQPPQSKAHRSARNTRRCWHGLCFLCTHRAANYGGLRDHFRNAVVDYSFGRADIG